MNHAVVQAQYDAVVVGGGIMGQSIALELVRNHMKTLLIYPEGHDRDCATLAAGAMIDAFGEMAPTQQTPQDLQKLEFRIRAQEMHPAWLERLGQESEHALYITQGLFIIANDGGRQDVANIDYIQTLLQAHGKAHEWVAPQDVPGLQPHERYPTHKVLFIPEGFGVDSAQLLSALEAAFSRHAYGTVLHDRVVSVTPQRGTRWLVRTQHHDAIDVPYAVVCAGARVPEAIGEVTLPRLVLPTLYFSAGMGCVVSGAGTIPYTIRTPRRTDACGLHIVPRAHKRLYIGASSHSGRAVPAARGITPGALSAILGDTNREINRTLRDTTIEDLRFGLRPISIQDAPLIGGTVLPGLFLATGTHRHGIQMAPLIAHVVSSEVLQNPLSVDNPFRPYAERNGGRDDPAYDANLANLYLSRGLECYNRWRAHGQRADLRLTLDLWAQYESYAGDYADPQILELMTRLQAGDIASVERTLW